MNGVQSLRSRPGGGVRGEGTEKGKTQVHRAVLDEPDAPLSCSERPRPCSAARQRTVIPRSGRRGRRFKSCHPDQVPQVRALTRVGEGLSCCLYRNKYRQYRNRSEHLMFSSIGLPQRAQRFVGTKRPQDETCHPDQRCPQVIPELGVPWLPLNSKWTAHRAKPALDC
jgi:hypothetical protein